MELPGFPGREPLTVAPEFNGGFVISRREDVTTLIIQYVGYEPFNLEVDPTDQDLYITLSGVATLGTIEVTGRKKEIVGFPLWAHDMWS